jgi:hypothetical protein
MACLVQMSLLTSIAYSRHMFYVLGFWKDSHSFCWETSVFIEVTHSICKVTEVFCLELGTNIISQVRCVAQVMEYLPNK